MKIEQAINWKQDASLFPTKEMYLYSHDNRGNNLAFKHLPEALQRRKKIDNMQIVQNLAKTMENKFPIVKAYSGPRDFTYVSYADRKKFDGKGCALGFFLYDSCFDVPVWYKLEYTTHEIAGYDIVFAPDYSLYIGESWEMQNKYNVYKARVVAAYWQYCGLNVIPVATWGSADSFGYCFEGLPDYSVIAVCGIGHDCDPLRHRLWTDALLELERQKRPTTIIVYGGKACTVAGLDAELLFLEDFITKRFRK